MIPAGGTNDHPQWYDASLYPGAVAGILAAHAEWIRVDGYVNTPSNPSVLSPTGPTGQWVAFLQQAKAAGLKVLVTAQGCTDPTYTECVVAAAKSGLFDGIEIGNELDMTNAIPATQYAGIVNSAAPAIKGAAPNVLVIVGAVANTNPGGDGSVWTIGYLGALTAEAKAATHAISGHFYNGWDPTGPVQPSQWWGGNGVAWAANSFVSVLRANGWTGPWWVTECGVSAMAGSDPNVSFATAGQWIGELLAILGGLSDPPEVIMQYQLSDQGQGTDINWGLYSDEGVTPNPALAAFQSYFAAPAPVAPPPPPAPAVDYEADSANCRTQLAQAVSMLESARVALNKANLAIVAAKLPAALEMAMHTELATVAGILEHEQLQVITPFLAAPLPTS